MKKTELIEKVISEKENLTKEEYHQFGVLADRANLSHDLPLKDAAILLKKLVIE